jgi:hypothetical protein
MKSKRNLHLKKGSGGPLRREEEGASKSKPCFGDYNEGFLGGLMSVNYIHRKLFIHGE